MRRFYYIQNLYPIFNMEFRNVIQSDEDFITNPNLEYTLYDTYANKLLLDKNIVRRDKRLPIIIKSL